MYIIFDEVQSNDLWESNGPWSLVPIPSGRILVLTTGTSKLCYSYDKLQGCSGCCYCFVVTILKNVNVKDAPLLKIWVQNWCWRLSMA